MMRKAKKLILTCLMSILVLAASAQTNQMYDWSKIMNAIIQVESQGNAKAHNANGDCVGILQITPILVKQCNIWLKDQKSSKRYTLKDRYDVEKSKEMFIMIQEHYNPSHNVEKAIRLWNGGPNYSVKKTNGYYKKVMKYYNGGK
jgi:predicted GH43/DUF377 family glycosyl hydrolase